MNRRGLLGFQPWDKRPTALPSTRNAVERVDLAPYPVVMIATEDNCSHLRVNESSGEVTFTIPESSLEHHMSMYDLVEVSRQDHPKRPAVVRTITTSVRGGFDVVAQLQGVVRKYTWQGGILAVSESNVRHAISHATSPSGEVSLTWGSSLPRQHHLTVNSVPSSGAVRTVLRIDGEEAVSRRVGTTFHYHHEAPGGRATTYSARVLDDNDEVVASTVSIELRESTSDPAGDSQ